MKKLVSLSIVLCGISGLLRGAEAAPKTIKRAFGRQEEIGEEKGVPHDAVFLHAGIRSGKRFQGESIFDAMPWSWENGSYVRRPGGRVIAPYVGEVDMAGIQHENYYYAFVPDRNTNQVLVFKLREDGTIQPTQDGQKFTLIETGAPVVSVTTVKDSNDTLIVAATTRAPSLEVFSLVEDRWNASASVPLSSPADASAAAAADASQSDVVVNSILHKGLIYLFMVDNNNPQVQVATMHPARGITMQNYPELTLPFTVGDMLEGYNIATVEHNNELYVFVVGASDKENGFIYGWKLEDNGRFVPVIQKQVDRLPHDIIVNDTPEGLYITITFFTDFSIEVYKLTGTSFEGPIGQSRVNALPIKARNVPYQKNRNVMVLVQSLTGLYSSGPYSLRVYQIDDRGLIQIADNPLPRMTAPYRDFLLIPGLTKQQVVKLLDEATGGEYPLDVVGSVAEFVVKNYKKR